MTKKAISNVESVKGSSAFDFKKAIQSEYAQGEFKNSLRKLYEVHNKCCEINGYENDVVKARYNDWSVNIIEKGMFVEGFNFTKILVKITDGKGRSSVDYICTDDMVKEVCMLFDTKIGKQIRQTYIEIEKAYKNQLALPQNYEQALEELLKKVKENNRLEQKNLLLEDKIEKEKPSVEYANSVGTNENTKNLQEGIKQLFNYIKKVNNAIKVLVDKKVLFRADEQNCSSPIVKFSADFNDVFKAVPIKTRTKNISTQVLLRVTPTAKAKLEKYIGIDAQPFLYANSMRKVAEVKLKIKNELFEPQN